jgi:hypothetical protein
VPSNSAGAYLFPALDPGDYSVAVQFAGFQGQTQTGIRLDANQNVHVNFSLHPGNVSQTVNVDAATTQIDTRESQVGQTIDQKQIEDLPLNGRNAQSLVQLVPGITTFIANSPIGTTGSASFSTNGNTQMSSEYLDGAYDESLYGQGINLIPNPDALQEFRVLTSNFDAEFGILPGAVINAITRSGSNKFHGLVYDYFRNNILNAKDYFQTSVQSLHQNQFGGNFSGPILRNKAFFFLDYEGLVIHTPFVVNYQSLITPTAAEATGDFSAQPTKLWPKMSNGQYYSCNGVMGVICPNLLDPVAKNALAFVPLATSLAGHPSQQNSNGDTTGNQELARFDYQLNDKHKLSATYFMSRGTTNAPNIGGNQILDYTGAIDYSSQYNAVLSDTWIVSPSKLNNLRLFYSLQHYIVENTFGNQHLLSSLGSQAAEGGNYNSPPVFTITGYWTMGAASNAQNIPESILGASDTFHWSLRNHEMKFGGAFLWDREDDHSDGLSGVSSGGVFTFSGGTTGNAMADFLLGVASSFNQSSDTVFLGHAPDPSLFIQDNWRLNQKLTVNLGLRWEAYIPWKAPDLSTFIPYQQSTVFPTAPLGLVTEGDKGVPNGLIGSSWFTFAPRVGFAYDLFGDGKTAVRAAFGIFDTRYRTPDDLSEQQPYARSVSISKTPNLVTPYAPGTDPFPYTPNAQNAVFVSNPTISTMLANSHVVPYVQQYNLTVQHEFGRSWSAQIAYVGNTLRKLYYLTDINFPVYEPGGLITTAGLNARRPYEPTPSTYQFGIIDQYRPENNSSYNGLQTMLTKRFAHQFSLGASYVWQSSIGLTNGGAGAIDSPNTRIDRGPIPQSIRGSVFVASYLWVSPQIAHWGFVGKQVLSGWQLNGITTVRDGAPYNVTSGVDTNLDGVSTTDRPNKVGNPKISGGRSRTAKITQYINPAAFQQVLAGTPYGNVSYDSQKAPPYINTDFSAFKNFTLEKGTLQFRGELYNLFNYVNLNAPKAVLTSPSFGQISGDVSPRIVQFALRYSF